MTLDLITAFFAMIMFVLWSSNHWVESMFKLAWLVLAAAFLIRHVDVLRGLL